MKNICRKNHIISYYRDDIKKEISFHKTPLYLAALEIKKVLHENEELRRDNPVAAASNMDAAIKKLHKIYGVRKNALKGAFCFIVENNYYEEDNDVFYKFRYGSFAMPSTREVIDLLKNSKLYKDLKYFHII